MKQNGRRHQVARLVDPNKPLEVKPLSDKGKLRWEQTQGPIASMVASLNSVVNSTVAQLQAVVIHLLLEQEGLDPEKGWKFNIARGRFERYTVTEEGQGEALGE